MVSQSHQQIARWLATAKRAIAFTGAGISTESGIPDFRSPGGIWTTSQPVYYDDFLRDADARYEYWRQKAVSHQDFVASKPNGGHRVLAEWEKGGQLRAVITQNIDGLHQLAGSRRVVELHGTAREIECQDCQARFPADPLVAAYLLHDTVPDCPECRGRLKHATISFGQQLNQSVLEDAIRLSEQADLYLAMGSSLVVEPAASLPRIARQRGARLVIINRDVTPLDDYADLVLHESIGTALEAIASCRVFDH